MICYTCGELIRGEDNDAVMCPACSIHYCGRCSEPDDLCTVCRGKLTPHGNIEFDIFSPSEMFVEVMDKEKREQTRTRVEVKCAFTIHGPLRPDLKKREYKALTKDVSKSGICILSTTPLQSGQRVHFKECSALPGRSVAVVRWVKKTKAHLYMAGLMFS